MVTAAILVLAARSSRFELGALSFWSSSVGAKTFGWDNSLNAARSVSDVSVQGLRRFIEKVRSCLWMYGHVKLEDATDTDGLSKITTGEETYRDPLEAAV